MKNLGIYIHVPFCVQKCNYCDFQSVANTNYEEHKAYFQGLQSEMLLWNEIYGNKYYVDSVFIGGGTPSCVAESHIVEMMKSLREKFTITQDAEITIEANPGTLTAEKLVAYRQSGINRLSIGAQSLDDEILKFMGRIHTSEDFYEAYHMARNVGFENINVDLMFGVPGMTVDSWKETLKKVMDLKPEHISFYSLQLEADTPFFEQFMEGTFTEVPDEINRQMYWEAVSMLKNGIECNEKSPSEEHYVHYEISNAAKPGFECKHNLKYWSLEDYLGIGLGAHSFMGGWRFNNLALKTHENTKEESMQEFVFTGMRKINGIDLDEFERMFGVSIFEIFGEEIKSLQNDKLILLYNKEKSDEKVVIEEEPLKEASNEVSDEDKRKNLMMKFTPFGIDVSNKALSLFV